MAKSMKLTALYLLPDLRLALGTPEDAVMKFTARMVYGYRKVKDGLSTLWNARKWFS